MGTEKLRKEEETKHKMNINKIKKHEEIKANERKWKSDISEMNLVRVSNFLPFLPTVCRFTV